MGQGCVCEAAVLVLLEACVSIAETYTAFFQSSDSWAALSLVSLLPFYLHLSAYNLFSVSVILCSLPLSLFFNSTSKYLIKFDLEIYMLRSVDFRNGIFCFPWRIYIFYIWTNNMNMFPWCVWIQRTAWRPEVTMHLLSDWHCWNVVSLLWAVETIDCKHFVCGYFFKCSGN